MSGLSDQFEKMVAERYRKIVGGEVDTAEQPVQYRLLRYFCVECNMATLHTFIGDEGIYEKYKCNNVRCGHIAKVAVR
jgi:hypothetical protein